MKFLNAAIILFIFAVLQISFFNLLNFIPIIPNFPLIAILILSFLVSFEDLMILSLISGFFTDLFSAVFFGTSMISLVIVFAAFRFLRKKAINELAPAEFAIKSLFCFIFFYITLAISNDLFAFLSGAPEAVLKMPILNYKIIIEILLDFFIAMLVYYGAEMSRRFSAQK